MKRTTIRVYPSSDAVDVRIQAAMAALTPVTFVTCSNLEECRNGDAVLNTSGDGDTFASVPATGVRFFHVAARGIEGNNGHTGGDSIRFTQSKLLDQRLRGRCLKHEPILGYAGLRTEPGDEVIAYYGSSPAWVIRNRENVLNHLVSVPLPMLAAGEMPFRHLRDMRFFPLLALLHFLREVTKGSGWKNPPLRACLMLDDPNLHWPSYGFLRYGKLIEEARARRFHVAFATVPLDAWGAHPRAVESFREHSDQFSLLVHGNDHSKHELSQSREQQSYLRLAAQSLRRVDRLEKTTGLHVARVMAPPHGALASSCLTALLAAGFEGACASTGDLREFSSDLLGPTFGLRPAEISAGSAPVIPRFRLDASCEGAIVISAFLDRPIVPVGHHHTAAGGLELLIHTAEIINSFGEVLWGSPEMMLRSNFRSFQEDEILWVEPYSCRIELTVPEGINGVGLYRSGDTFLDPNSEFAFVARRRGGPESLIQQNFNSTPLKAMSGEHLELVSLGLGKVDYREVENPEFSLSLRAFPRRLVCEFRDRFMPLIPRDLIPEKWTSG